MSSIVSKLVALVTFAGAFVLLPSASQAGSGKVEFVVVSSDASADAPICPVVECQVSPDPMKGFGSQPAIGIDMDSDQVVHLEADLHTGLGCKIFVDTVMGDLALPMGHVNVYINFQPPLDDGTEMSITWRVGDDPKCAPACSDYTIGVDPAVCM